MVLDWFTWNGWTVAIVAVLLILMVSRSLQWPANVPPGPTGYPIVGSILLLSGKKKPKETFRQLRVKFGDVFSLTLGRNLLVVINGVDALKEAFIKRADDFSDRPDTYRSATLMKRKGVAMSSGQHWKHTRTFALTTLREFGFGKKSLEARVMEEVYAFLDVMGNNSGKVYDPKHVIQISISNIICSIVFGKRFEHSDAKFYQLVDLLEEAFRLNQTRSAARNMSWLRFLPGDFFKIKRNRDNFYEISDYMQQQITDHRNTFDPSNPRDFIDAFLKEQERQEPGSAVFEDFNLQATISNLFVAGTETTATTIRWTILQLIYHTDIQDRLRREIENVIGPSRFPTLSDKENMPYYKAVITEALRFGNIAPFSVPHGASKDVEFRGMTIPKGSTIIPNLDSVHFDPNVFKEPTKFNPDRFLGEDGKLNGKEKYVFAFSLGRRICLGESLARLELFLFLTTLIQRFELLPENPDKMPAGPPSKGIQSGPPDYKVKAVKIN
ncbi:cytochrome P450 2B5-like [Mizuhopecten yessoensis]|uniref:cytochrome P450 2B5-like n=1 Tax=Mizuhopecten yessoensis TaxID=6573 RepID=UPI000B45BF44|nr:cytochrome P450 2B5-like [Mizuhopecten yessoensis]